MTDLREEISMKSISVNLPPTKIDKKYDLYITILRKWRRY